MDHQEDRYKRLDAAIRHHQYSRRMVAATKEQGKKRKRSFQNREKADQNKKLPRPVWPSSFLYVIIRL